MPITLNNDPQAIQAQEPKVNTPLDRSKDSNFASLMKGLEKNKSGQTTGQSSGSTPTPLPPAGSKEERIYKAVMTSSEKYNLPPALVLGFIKQESGFKPEAKSWCGARGLMQLMPGTAKQLGVTDSFNIEQNVDGGCKYIRQMLDKFDGNLEKSIAAYNAGPGAVIKYNGVPPFAETKNYVPAVMAHAAKFNNGAPITVAGGGGGNNNTVAAAVVAPKQQPIDYRLVVDAVQGSDAMTQAAMALAITSNVQPVNMPESKRNVDDGPPPPPPPPSRAVRV
jgi:hypothetical protein